MSAHPKLIHRRALLQFRYDVLRFLFSLELVGQGREIRLVETGEQEFVLGRFGGCVFLLRQKLRGRRARRFVGPDFRQALQMKHR